MYPRFMISSFRSNFFGDAPFGFTLPSDFESGGWLTPPKMHIRSPEYPTLHHFTLHPAFFKAPLSAHCIMTTVGASAIEALRTRLTTATIYVPGIDGYEESLTRWSDTGMKRAVSDGNHGIHWRTRILID